MKDETLLLVAGGGFLVWYLTRRPVVVSASSPAPNLYGNAAGFYSQPGVTSDPGDRNNWGTQLTQTLTGLAGLGTGIANAVAKASGPGTSSGYDNGGSSYGGNTVGPEDNGGYSGTGFDTAYDPGAGLTDYSADF